MYFKNYYKNNLLIGFSLHFKKIKFYILNFIHVLALNIFLKKSSSR